MAYAVTFERLAEADLRETDAYLSARNPQGATNVIHDIFDAIDVVATYPLASRPLAGSTIRYRSSKKYKYRIFFEIVDMELRILAIRHPRSGTPEPEQLL